MIVLDRIVYAAGAFRLEASLRIEAGSYFVLLGPTGSGKTVCMECLAGLRPLLSGRVEIGGRDVTRAEPRARSIGYVPQDYALFGQRTVRGNIAFGPEVRKWAKPRIAEAVASAAELAGVGGLLARRVQGLSGGERQRVALARALASRPDILVLDEPVSALDEGTRERVCGELLALQRRLGLTTVHVCHNLEEALTVADAAAVMRDGRIEQTGPIEELLRRPRTEFVARFMRCENILRGEAEGEGPMPGTTRVRVAGVAFAVPGRHAGQVTLVARPENWTLASAASAPPAANAVPGKATRTVDRGAYVRVELEGPLPLVVHLPRATLRSAGSAELIATIRPEDIHVL